MARLMKVGHSRNSKATMVVKAEWEKFIIEENLSSLMEGANQTFVEEGKKEGISSSTLEAKRD